MQNCHLIFLILVVFAMSPCCSTVVEACSLYLAPSRVSGGGKGNFSGVRIKAGKAVGQSEGLIIDDYLVQGKSR